VSRQGVHQAVKRGVLRVGADGLIDPEVEPNKSWVALHVKHGLDRRGRDMRTYGRRPGTEVRERVPIEVSEDTDSPDEAVPGAFFTDAEIDAILAEGDLTRVVREMQAEQRAALRRVHERLDEINERLRIARDPFLGLTVAGQRLRQKDEDEARRKSATAPAGTQGRRRGVR